MDNATASSAPNTVAQRLSEIQSYFGILAYTELVSLSDTEEPDVLCLRGAKEIGGIGLDLFEELRNKLSKSTGEATKPTGPVGTAPRLCGDPVYELGPLAHRGNGGETG